MMNRRILGIIMLVGTTAIISGVVFVSWYEKEPQKQPPSITETADQIPSKTDQRAEVHKTTLSCASANVYIPPALRQDLDIISYLDKNMLGMVKADPVASAELSMDSVWFFPGNKVFAAASFINESGGVSSGFYGGVFFEHIYFLGQYSFENHDEVRVDYLDEATERGTVRQSFQDRKLLVKYGLADQNTPVSPDRAYSRTRKADCPWILSAFKALPSELDPFESVNPAASITIKPIGNHESVTNREFVYLDLTCSEPGAIKDVRYTDEEGFTTEPFQPFQSRITWDLKKEGANTITYQCRDNDGDITTVSDSIVHDTTGPILSDGKPTDAEVLPAGTTSINISLKTNEPATCRYAKLPNTSYFDMENTFSSTGTLTHQTTITELSGGDIFSYFIRCADTIGNTNTDRLEISFRIGPFPQSEDLVSISQGRTWAIINAPMGAQLVHADDIRNILKKELYPASRDFLFSGIAKVSPDKGIVALDIEDGSLSGFTALYRISTRSLSHLGSGSPTAWSPNGKYLLAHVSGFELEDAEVIYDIGTGHSVSSIDNNLNQKKILGWGSEDTVEYTTEDGENYLEIRWSFNVENGETTKISETPYPLPTPQILRAYMNENIGPTGTVVIVWTTERPAQARVYWALDKEGPWSKIDRVGGSWHSPSFVVPDVPPGQEKIFYRMVSFANDGREGNHSVIIEGKPTCCWTGELLDE